MGKFSVRYLVAKRQKGHTLFYWQPNRVLREAGFLPRRLAERANDLADAIREAEDLNRQLDAWRAGHQPVPIQPGTIPWLIRLYREDPRYTDLALSSQRSYDNRLATIEAWSARAGHPPIRTIERKHCKVFYRSMSATPGIANAVMRMLRVLLAFAIDEGELGSNPAEKMRLRGRPPRDQVWMADQIAAFVGAAEQHSNIDVRRSGSPSSSGPRSASARATSYAWLGANTTAPPCNYASVRRASCSPFQ